MEEDDDLESYYTDDNNSHYSEETDSDTHSIIQPVSDDRSKYIGVIVAQSLGQPITQMALSSFKQTGKKEFSEFRDTSSLNQVLKPSEHSMEIYPTNTSCSESLMYTIPYRAFSDIVIKTRDPNKFGIGRLTRAKYGVDIKTIVRLFSENYPYNFTISDFIRGEVCVEPFPNVFLENLNFKTEEIQIDLNKKLWGFKKIKNIKKVGSKFITEGSSLGEVLSLNYVDTEKTITNNIEEVIRYLGIEAARYIIIKEIHKAIRLENTFKNKNICLLANQICRDGDITYINRYGLKKLGSGFLRRLSFESMLEVLYSFEKEIIDPIQDPSSKIITGSEF